MDSGDRSRWLSRLKLSGIFAIHQLFGMWGIALLAYYLGDCVFEFLRLFNLQYSMRSLHWILTETPFFPVQIALGLYFGWMLSHRLKHRSMLWIWVIPALLLGYCVVAIPSLTVAPASVLMRSENPISHYFGWACKPKDHCIDQVIVTLPFYTAVAYSIAAWAACKFELFQLRQNAKSSAPPCVE